MAINQIESRQFSQLPQTSPNVTPLKVPTSSFSDAINTAVQKLAPKTDRNPALLAAEASERLQLDMMKSALSLGGEPAQTSVEPFTIPINLGMYELIHESQNTDINKSTSTIQQETLPDDNRASGSSIQDIVEKASQRYGVDGALIKAVIKAESNFNPSAVSHAGAQGLMQLMPATARGLGVSDSFNPEQNIMAGTRFLKDMINRYHGNLDAALAAYNWGPGNVDRKGISSLPQETREYLAKVKNLYNQYTA